MEHRARGDPREDALPLEQHAHAADRVLVGDEDLAVELGDVEDRRHVAVRERAKAVHEVALKRLGGRNDRVGIRLADTVAGAHQRPAGPEARNERVDL